MRWLKNLLIEDPYSNHQKSSAWRSARNWLMHMQSTKDLRAFQPVERKVRSSFDSNIEEITRQRSQAEAVHLMHKADCYGRYTTNHNRGHNEGIFEKCFLSIHQVAAPKQQIKRHRCTVTKLYNRIQTEAIPPKVAIVASATTGSSVPEVR